jgi:hypothetical protein
MDPNLKMRILKFIDFKILQERPVFEPTQEDTQKLVENKFTNSFRVVGKDDDGHEFQLELPVEKVITSGDEKKLKVMMDLETLKKLITK